MPKDGYPATTLYPFLWLSSPATTLHAWLSSHQRHTFSPACNGDSTAAGCTKLLFFLNFQVSAAGLYILLLLFFELYLICHLMHWVGSLLLPFLPLSNLPRLQLGVGLLVG